MRNILHKSCRENENTQFMPNKFFFFKTRAVYEVMWKNTDRENTDTNITQGLRIACWITKAVGTHSEYVICHVT
jgi:hypothetical protein